MESVLAFWRRAFPAVAASRRLDVLHERAQRVQRPLPLRFTEELRGGSQFLPSSTVLFVDTLFEQSIGRSLAFFDVGGHRLTAVSQCDDRVVFHFDPWESARAMMLETYAPPRRPLASRCPFHYHRVPGRFRLTIGRWATKLSRMPDAGFPPWPVADGVEALRRCVLLCATGSAPDMDKALLWPSGKRWAISLSHDADSVESARSIPAFAEVEERHGFRSTWFFPAGGYRLDKMLLGDLRASGHEIACHGYTHDCKLAYLRSARMARQVRRAAETLSAFGATGFRSPALGRSPALFEALQGSFSYDSSVPDTDEHSGCCTVFPFPIGNLTEVPITVPMDASLILRGYRPAGILHVWEEKIRWVKEMRGVATIVTHPEPHFSGNRPMLETYAELLSRLASEPEAWVAPLGEIAGWWRAQAPAGPVSSPSPETGARL